MKQKLSISINPLYKCSENCPFCYVGNLKNSLDTLDLTYLTDVLTELNYKFDIIDINIVGGEITELSDFYCDFLLNLIKTFSKQIIVTTNFIKFNKSLINDLPRIRVSLDFNNYRQNFNIVKDNIKAAVNSGKVIDIVSLDISCQKNEEDIIDILNNLHVQTWEIIPYYKTSQTKLDFQGYSFFENTVKTFLHLSSQMKFNFINKNKLEKIIDEDNYNVTRINIEPNNSLSLTKFNKNNELYFEHFPDVDSLLKDLSNEENKKENYCKECKLKNKCLATYYNYNYTGESCSGYKNLILSYKK